MGRIPHRELMHGAALLQLVPESGGLTIEKVDTGYTSGYIINGGKLGVYLKITTQVGGKAQFSFSPENVSEMMDVQRQSDNFYLGLVSASDGVCALSWDEFASLVAAGEKRHKTLAMRKMHRSRFRVWGSDSEKVLIIPVNRWSPALVPL